MLVNEFMLNLHNQIMKNGVSDNTATNYIKNLFVLNNKKPFSNLAFLKKYDNIDNILKPYANSTKKTFLGSILGVLKLFKDKATYKKVYNHYTEKLDGKVKEMETIDKNKKNDKQEKNWISWEDVLNIKNDLEEKLNDLKKNITAKQYENILKYFVLSLYTDIPPRRNKDYQDMVIVKKCNDSLSKDKNYFCLDDKKLIFNVYKTSKSNGTQEEDISENEPLLKAFNLYFKYHPLNKGRFGKNKQIPLLVKQSGEPLNNINSMTRLLNKIFGKKVGASMLRHIYLSNKYGDVLEDMKEDAEDMGHSLSTQKEYIKTD